MNESERLYKSRLWGAELGEQVTRPTLNAGESAYPVFDEQGRFLEWWRQPKFPHFLIDHTGLGALRYIEPVRGRCIA